MKAISEVLCERVCRDTPDVLRCKTICEPSTEAGLQLLQTFPEQGDRQRKAAIGGLGLILILFGGVYLARKLGGV